MTNDKPFSELPAALVQEVLERTEGISKELLERISKMVDFGPNPGREWTDGSQR